VSAGKQRRKRATKARSCRGKKLAFDTKEEAWAHASRMAKQTGTFYHSLTIYPCKQGCKKYHIGRKQIHRR
jgi:hypothetical protein